MTSSQATRPNRLGKGTANIDSSRSKLTRWHSGLRRDGA